MLNYISASNIKNDRWVLLVSSSLFMAFGNVANMCVVDFTAVYGYLPRLLTTRNQTALNRLQTDLVLP